MFQGFNLEVDDSLKDLLNEYYDYGEKICSVKRKDIAKSLNQYIGKDGHLDCSAIQKDWFPTMKSNIFISHSHDDEKLAVSLAGWLYYEFGLVSFIDSYVWGYCNDLLRDIDNEYSRHSNGHSYDYDKRNNSTSHVHMMLSTALTKMIDKTECVIFLNTDKSILKTTDVLSTKTQSPWIYYEIITTRLIQKIIPDRLKFITKKALNETFETAEKILKTCYDADLDHLAVLSYKDLNIIFSKYYKLHAPVSTDALDKLYEITHII